MFDGMMNTASSESHQLLGYTYDVNKHFINYRWFHCATDFYTRPHYACPACCEWWRFAGEFVERLREGGRLRVSGTAIGLQIRLALV